MNFELNNIVWENKNSLSPAEKIFDAKTFFRKISENGFRAMGFLIVENRECYIKINEGHTRCIYIETEYPKRNGFILLNTVPLTSPLINEHKMTRVFIDSMFTIIYSHGLIETFEHRRINGENLMLKWVEKRKDVDGKNSQQFFKEIVSYKIMPGLIIIPKKFDRAFFHEQEIDFRFFENFDCELRIIVKGNNLHFSRQYNSRGKTLYSENSRGKNIKYIDVQTDYDEKFIFRNIKVEIFNVGDGKTYIDKNSIVETNEQNNRGINNTIIFRGKNVMEIVAITENYVGKIQENWIAVEHFDAKNYVYKLLSE